jgi:hypothetical protein
MVISLNRRMKENDSKAYPERETRPVARHDQPEGVL